MGAPRGLPGRHGSPPSPPLREASSRRTRPTGEKGAAGGFAGGGGARAPFARSLVRSDGCRRAPSSPYPSPRSLSAPSGWLAPRPSRARGRAPGTRAPAVTRGTPRRLPPPRAPPPGLRPRRVARHGPAALRVRGRAPRVGSRAAWGGGVPRAFPHRDPRPPPTGGRAGGRRRVGGVPSLPAAAAAASRRAAGPCPPRASLPPRLPPRPTGVRRDGKRDAMGGRVRGRGLRGDDYPLSCPGSVSRSFALPVSRASLWPPPPSLRPSVRPSAGRSVVRSVGRGALRDATSDQTWRPAEFKHISQRRKRN